jgi:hypothetical protein
MSTATTPANAAGAVPAAGPLNRSSFGLVVLLIVELVLGSAQAIYGTTPSPGHSIGIFSTALLGTHFIWGILTIIAAIVFLVQAIRAKLRSTIITGAVGLLALVVAAAGGSSFTHDGKNGSSLMMAIATGVALFCYTFNLRFLKGN